MSNEKLGILRFLAWQELGKNRLIFTGLVLHAAFERRMILSAYRPVQYSNFRAVDRRSALVERSTGCFMKKLPKQNIRKMMDGKITARILKGATTYAKQLPSGRRWRSGSLARPA